MAPADTVLAIDAGNTRIKWALHADGAWTASGAVPTERADALANEWKHLPALGCAIGSNVAGAAVARVVEEACAARGASTRWIRAAARQLGVENGYLDPAQLGPDRWAALLAAHAREHRHQLVVTVGTALTIDALEAGGRFLGGLIVPGPALMRRALEGATARLRETQGDFAAFPQSTPEAITSGALQACAGAVERMADAMAARGTPVTGVALSGGAAAEIAPHLPLPYAIHENLVLEGLVLLARPS